MPPDIQVLRQSGQIVNRVQFHVANRIANIAIEFLPDRGDAFIQFANFLACRFVLVDTGKAKPLQRLLDRETRFRVSFR